MKKKEKLSYSRMTVRINFQTVVLKYKCVEKQNQNAVPF